MTTQRLANILTAVLRVTVAVVGAVVLTGCSAMVQPEDIAVAEELCAKRGGFTHVARFERGRHLSINCKDGSQIDILRGKATD